MSPLMGFLLNEKFAMGGRLAYSYYNSKYGDQTYVRDYTATRYSIALISRRYFSITEKFVFAIDGNLVYSRGRESEMDNTTESKTKNYQIGISLSPTFIFFPSPKWGLEASIGAISYDYSRNLSNDSDQNYFNLEYGRINLGISYYFRRGN